MKIYAVSYLAALYDEISASTEVFPTRDEAKQYVKDELETLHNDYPRWQTLREAENEVVFGSANYDVFVEMKITEHEVKISDNK